MPYYNLGRVYQIMADKNDIKYYVDSEYNLLKSIELPAGDDKDNR